MSLASRARPWLEGAAALLAALLPLGVALSLAATSPQWRDDAAVVRGLGLSLSPGAGAASTLLGLAFRLLPLGNVTFRAALVSALALSLVGVLLFALVRRLLEQARPSALSVLLSLVASLTATLSPLMLREASVGGGATVAVALALGALLVGVSAPERDERRWLGLGLLLGMTLAESAVAALVLGGALVVQGLLRRPQRGERALQLGAAGLGAALVLVLVPVLIRPLAPASWVGLGLTHGFGEIRALDVVAMRGRGLGAWISSLGVAAFALSALGAALGLTRSSLRAFTAPLLVPLVIDVVAPATRSGVLALDPLASLRALSLCAAAATAALGVHTAALWLRERAWPMARPAGALVVAFHATLAAMAAEEGFAQADRSRNVGAEAWTDHALEQLPPNALVLARSEPVLWRLWSARLASGARPDVTVVPLSLLGRGKLAGALLAEEPALAPLLRDISATSVPSEFSLAHLADVRPLFLESLPPSDRRIASHLADDHLWLRFSPQPLGLSDRRAGQGAATVTFFRVVGAARRDEPHDEATLEVLGAHARELALATGLAGDRESSQQALLHLGTLNRDPAPDDSLWELLDPTRKPDPRRKRARR